MEITIIIPVKNRREYIGHTLDSIVNSSVQPKEVIIVDNESTDGTYQFCEQYIKDRTNFTLLRETFPGAAAARNKGLKSCKTEWVYFFDSDDLFDKEFLSVMNQLNTEGYDMIAVPTKMNIGGKEKMREYIPFSDPKAQILANVLNTQSMVFRTNYVKEIGAWNVECRIWDDWELGLRAMLHQPKILWFQGKAFHTINVHAESITGDSFTNNYKQLIRTLTVAVNNLNSSILQPLSLHHAQNLDCLYPHLDKLMLPLYYRTGILLGNVLNEKLTGKRANYKMAANTIEVFRNENFHPTLWQKIIGNCLIFYTHMGGRGAWRVAMNICKKK